MSNLYIFYEWYEWKCEELASAMDIGITKKPIFFVPTSKTLTN
jgi:hypothetical protein